MGDSDDVTLHNGKVHRHHHCCCCVAIDFGGSNDDEQMTTDRQTHLPLHMMMMMMQSMMMRLRARGHPPFLSYHSEGGINGNLLSHQREGVQWVHHFSSPSPERWEPIIIMGQRERSSSSRHTSHIESCLPLSS